MPNTPNRLYPYPAPADPVDVNGDIQELAEAIDLDLETRDVVIQQRPYAKIRGATVQETPPNQTNIMRFDIEDLDTDDMVDLTVDRYSITIKTAGFYWVWGRLRMYRETPLNTVNVLFITRNGITSTISRTHTMPPVGTTPYYDQTFGSCAPFVVGDVVQLWYIHAAGTIQSSRFRDLAAFRIAN